MENKYTENGDKKNKYNRQVDGNGKRQGQNGRKKTWDRAAKQGSDWNIRPYLAVGLTIFLVFCCCIFVICMLFRFQVVRGVLRDIVKVSERELPQNDPDGFEHSGRFGLSADHSVYFVSDYPAADPKRYGAD